jgi:hypothetical protein
MLKLRNVRKLFVFILVITLITSTSIIASADSTENDYLIGDVDAFVAAMLDVGEDGVITSKEKRLLVSETNPSVIAEFVEEKLNEAEGVIDDLEPVFEEQSDGSFAYTETVELDDDCFMEVELTEGEDISVLTKIANFFIEPVYAASNGEEKFKEMGNRYFTAKHTLIYPIGKVSFTLENHYTVSKDGLKERYGIPSYVRGLGTGTYSCGSPQIVTQTATKIDKSIRIDCRFNVSSGAVGITGTLAYNMKTTVMHGGFNPKRTGIYVQHNWSWVVKK